MSERMVPLVFRIPKRHREALRQLSKRTRIRMSEFVREGLADVLHKHSADLGEPKKVGRHGL